MKVADIRVQGRATQGVRVINLEKRNDTIASVCCVDSENEEVLEKELEQLHSEESADAPVDNTALDVESPESDN